MIRSLWLRWSIHRALSHRKMLRKLGWVRRKRAGA
jgi:hypothetical protein